MPVLINPEIIGASFPVKASDQPYQAMYWCRSCVNHCDLTISSDHLKRCWYFGGGITMSAMDISQSDSTGAPNRPRRIRLA